MKCEEGFAVVKVFVIHDPSLDLEAYKEQVENIRAKLKHASNCLPYQNIMVTEKAALLFRYYFICIHIKYVYQAYQIKLLIIYRRN